MKYPLAILAFLLVIDCFCQSNMYLIGEDAEVRFNVANSNPTGESVFFDAKPIVRYKIHNNISKRLKVDSKVKASASYILFSPHVRMFNQRSEPVRMPSYQIGVGYQQVWKFNPNDTDRNALLFFGVESGHYSNGQSGCTFSDSYDDNTQPCDNINSIMNANQNINLSQALNRTNGHFQTNFSQIQVGYRFFKKDEKGKFISTNSFVLGYTNFHKFLFYAFNFGGYRMPSEIEIYGKHRFKASWEHSYYHWLNTVVRIKQDFTLIAGAHQSIQPLRSESSLTLYPFPDHSNFGIKASYIFGHDDYNIRFVDSVNQLTLGVVYSPFGLFSMNKRT